MKAERGEMVGYNGNYGYKCNVKENKLEIIEKEAKVVRMIFKSYIDGKSCNEIAKVLTSMKILSPRGLPKWQYTTINKILRNKKYIGDLELI